MPTPKAPPIKQLTSWSFSRYQLYSECPRHAYYKFILKLPQPTAAPLERGTAIHKLAEQYSKGEIKRLPKELSLFKNEFSALKNQKAKYTEETWAFKKDWTPTTYNDWKECWLRVKVDDSYINPEFNTLVIVDHKTGSYSKYKLPEYEHQLQLYALGGLKQFRTIDAVSPRLWYLDEGVIHPEEEVVFYRKDEKYLQKTWEGNVRKMMLDTTFKPTPSDHACKFCPHKKASGGPCRY